MSDPFDRPEANPGAPAAPPPEGAAFPWDAAPTPSDPDDPRQRHDAFTEARKCAFLTALVRSGCVLDACRAVGIAARTVYLHQESDRRFADHCAAALRMSSTPIELTAWQRAVEGVEQEFACGGQVHVRRRYDGGLLRLLLQGSNPKKYGPRPGFKRKRLLKEERKQIEREVRAEIKASTPKSSREETDAAIARNLEAFKRRMQRERLAAGWTQTGEGHWIPPGYGRVAPLQGPAEGEPPAESM